MISGGWSAMPAGSRCAAASCGRRRCSCSSIGCLWARSPSAWQQAELWRMSLAKPLALGAVWTALALAPLHGWLALVWACGGRGGATLPFELAALGTAAIGDAVATVQQRVAGNARRLSRRTVCRRARPRTTVAARPPRLGQARGPDLSRAWEHLGCSGVCPGDMSASKGKLVRNTLSAAALALALAASAPAWAQTQSEFSDEQLQSFVVAAVAVDELIRQWNPRIQGAENAEQAALLREQANAELVETITRTEGMTVEQYQEIGQAAQSDPELAARINEIYQKQARN